MLVLRAITSIEQIDRTVDDQGIGGFRPPEPRQRPTSRAERDEPRRPRCLLSSIRRQSEQRERCQPDRRHSLHQNFTLARTP